MTTTTLTTGNQEEAADVSFAADLNSGETYYIVVKDGSSLTILDSFVADSFTNSYSLTVSLLPLTPYSFNGSVSGYSQIEIVDSCGNPVNDTIKVALDPGATGATGPTGATGAAPYFRCP